MPLIGKLAFWTLTVFGVGSVVATLIAGPPNGGWHRRPRTVAQSSYCNYTLFAETPDTTFWESTCIKPAHPWDTVYIVRDK